MKHSYVCRDNHYVTNVKSDSSSSILRCSLDLRLGYCKNADFLPEQKLAIQRSGFKYSKRNHTDIMKTMICTFALIKKL